MTFLKFNSFSFEKNFNDIIGTYKGNIKSSEFRYHVITILVTKDGEMETHMRNYSSFAIAVAETLLFAREFYKIKANVRIMSVCGNDIKTEIATKFATQKVKVTKREVTKKSP